MRLSCVLFGITCQALHRYGYLTLGLARLLDNGMLWYGQGMVDIIGSICYIYSMPKINEKCLACSKISFKGKHERFVKGDRAFPSCFERSKCHRKRNYYRYLDDKRKYQRNAHIYLRYKGDTCAICQGNEILQVHHIKPQVLGMDDNKNNCMTLCIKCHVIITTYYNAIRCIQSIC